MCIESAGDRPTYDVLMPRLVATLPDNYFYAGRYGQNRLDRGRVREALPYLKRAPRRYQGAARQRPVVGREHGASETAALTHRFPSAFARGTGP